MVKAMPVLLRWLSTIGIAAMLWVGGHILLVGAHELGWHWPYGVVHDLEDAVQDVGAVGGVLAWLVNTAASALVGLAGVPLAALGVDTLVRWLAAQAPRRARPSTVLLPVAAALAAVVLTGLAVPDTARVVSTWYRPDWMLTPTEQAFVSGVADVVPSGQRVIGNPWNGAALSGPLGHREAVFPHLVGRWDPDRELLATSLATDATTPEVCRALGRLKVEYVLTGPSGFWSGDSRRESFAGLEVAGREGFDAVAQAGRVALWRVTACRGMPSPR